MMTFEDGLPIQLLQKRASQDRVRVALDPSGEGLSDLLEPASAILVAQRNPPFHLVDIFPRMQRISVAELPTQFVSQTAAHRCLACTGHSHENDYHGRESSQPMHLAYTATAVLVLLSVALVRSPGFAQTPPVQPQTPTATVQSPVTISPLQSASTPIRGVPANILTPSTTNQLEPNAAPQARGGPTFGSAGRGLPGMTGGPPLNRPMGAQDPSPGYLTPPSVGPLFCDPDVNVPC